MNINAQTVMWAALTTYNGYCCYANVAGLGWFLFSFALFAFSAYRFAQCVMARKPDEQ